MEYHRAFFFVGISSTYILFFSINQHSITKDP